MTEQTGITEEFLLATSGAYWRSCALQAAVKLKIFTVLGEESRTADEVTAAIGGTGRGTAMLLNALTAMGILRREGKSYRNTPEARNLLVEDAPAYVGHIIIHHHHLMSSWNRLAEAVRTGKPQRPAVSRDETAVRESFILGMCDIARRRGPAVVRRLPLDGKRRLLDLGGGTGIYAVLFCEENPALTAVVFDLPANRDLAERTIARRGLTARIAFRGGDFLREDLGGPYDVAWLSQILHGEGPAVCRRLIRNTAAALTPGGTILIQEFLLEDTGDAPLHPALFSLNMLVGTTAGQSYTVAEITGMLTDAGFVNIARLPGPSPQGTGIISGEKPK